MTNRRDACVASWKPQSLYVAVSCCVGVDCYLLWGDWKMSYNQRWLPAISKLICLSLYNTQYFRIPVSPLNSLLSIFKVEASQCCKCYVNGGLAPLMNSNDFCSCGRKITLKCFLFVTQFTCCFLANLMISRRVVWMKHFLVFFPPTVPPDMHVDTRPFVLFSLSHTHKQTNITTIHHTYCVIFLQKSPRPKTIRQTRRNQVRAEMFFIINDESSLNERRRWMTSRDFQVKVTQINSDFLKNPQSNATL